jgi:hypothetical protein
MSEEQRAKNLGIDPDLANRDPLAYEVALRRKREALNQLRYHRPRWLTEDVLKVLRLAKERRFYRLLYHLAGRLIDLGCEDWIIRLCIGTGSLDEYTPASDDPRTSDEVAQMFIDQLLVHDTNQVCRSTAKPVSVSQHLPEVKVSEAEMAFVTALELRRQGTPGYVLLRAGLIKIEDSSGSYRLQSTDSLRGLFADLQPNMVTDVLAVLQDYVLAYAFDQSSFLDGSSLNMDAVNRLRGFGATDAGLGQLRSLIVKAAVEVAKDLERSRKAYR